MRRWRSIGVLLALLVVLTGLPVPAAAADPTYSISGVLWKEWDYDGIRSSWEPRWSGITVRLFMDDGSSMHVEVGTTTTAANGSYSFAVSGPGSYYFNADIPAGYAPTKRDAGTDDTVDSDDYPINNPIELTAEQPVQVHWDAGYRPYGVGNRAWWDTDGDGWQDPGEPGAAGIVMKLVRLSDPSVVFATTTTNAEGMYHLDIPSAANAFSLVVIAKVPGRAVVSATRWASPEWRNDGGGNVFDSTATSHVLPALPRPYITTDLGLQIPTRLGDRIWFDKDGDGRQDAAEPGVGGLEVRLISAKADTVVATTTTARDGSWKLVSPYPGTFRVQVVLDCGWTPSRMDDAGAGEAADSDLIRTGARRGQTEVFRVRERDQSIRTIDGGLRKRSC